MKTINRSRNSYSILATTLLLILLGGVHQVQAQWSTVGSGPDVYKTNTSGNVGVGTSIPKKPLHIVATNATTGIAVGKDDALNLMLFGYDTANNVGAIGSFANGSPSTLLLNSLGGNVGIGTSTPAGKLEILNTSGSNNPSYYLQLTGTTADNNNFPGISFRGGTDATEYPSLRLTNNGLAMMLYAGRNSTSYPNRMQLALSTNTNGYAAFQVYNGTTTTDLLTVADSGKIGIGTSVPGAKLDILSTGTARVIAGDGCDANAGTYGGIGLGVSAFSACTNYSLLGEGTNLFINTPSASGIIHFRSANNVNDKMTILGNGNVGIGKTNPTYNLDVTGTAHVTSDLLVDGNIQAKFQDVAEWVPSTHALAAGTVVILNPNKSNEVMPSISAYDTRVAGVVSERPGLALGEAGKDKSLVATTGRVKVKVDATKAPIHIGDLLVTSDREGYAMKSEPITIGGRQLHAPGTLIGKALEPLETGTGEILVLLSLQ